MATRRVRLPTLVATSVVRGAEQGDSHGGIYLVDFARETVRQVVDWDHSGIDFQGRGWDRGLRGIAFHRGEVYIAASDELFVYGPDFRIRRSFRNTYLRHCHEICRLERHLYLASTGHDAVLAFDLAKQAFAWGLHLADDGAELRARAFDPNGLSGPGGPAGPPAQNLLHLNNVHADRRGLFVSGLRTRGILHVGPGHAVSRMVEMPEGMHNARPFRDGVLFNDTAADRVRYVARDGRETVFPVPLYAPERLERADLADGRLARQGFARGLCVIEDGVIAAGSSPSTVTVYDLDSASEIARVNFSLDIRNAIHGLEVWPFADTPPT